MVMMPTGDGFEAHQCKLRWRGRGSWITNHRRSWSPPESSSLCPPKT